MQTVQWQHDVPWLFKCPNLTSSIPCSMAQDMPSKDQGRISMGTWEQLITGINNH